MTTVFIQQRDLLTNRWRNLEQLDPSELTLHIALVSHLRSGPLRDGVLWYHIPNGEYRDRRSAAKLKAMGLLPGVADLIFQWQISNQARTLYLELKREKGKPTENQKLFSDRARTAGCAYEVVNSMDEALLILRRHKLIDEKT